MLKITTLKDYCTEYDRSVSNPEAFWESIAKTFVWKSPWDKVLEYSFEDYSLHWFKGGTLNITENCLDRHLENRGDAIAYFWESNDIHGKHQRITYKELHAKVCQLSRALLKMGVGKGDRVCIYMPMIPELAIAVLACARIGAVHSVIFAGFSAKALQDRIQDASTKVVLTTDEGLRGEKKIPLKAIVDEALEQCPTVTHCLVFAHTAERIPLVANRDFDWTSYIKDCSSEHLPAVTMNAEDPLFILYTSGSTGKPKGVVHTCGGYMVYAQYTFENVFQYTQDQTFWCTADVGWITGHSYMVYGPLLAGATSVLFEGVPTWPDPSRFWKVVDKYKVNIFYTAPTAIRALMAFGDSYPESADLSSLKVLGTVGEPINEEAWKWYHHIIGKNHCPIVDTWWQTETGGIMISTLAGIVPAKPTCAGLPLPGIQPVLLDTEGKELLGNNQEGNLCIKYPWPSALRTTYGDHERCKQTYFSTYKGYYFTGDGCRRDEDGYYRILGRVDDVINVSGHRMGTAEVEDAINQHPSVVESAVVGYPHAIKGQGIYAFVIIDPEVTTDPHTLSQQIKTTVQEEIGAIAKPDKIQIVRGLPKTRSGKIMRRILRKISEGMSDQLGDISTLLDPSVVEEIIKGAV